MMSRKYPYVAKWLPGTAPSIYLFYWKHRPYIEVSNLTHILDSQGWHGLQLCPSKLWIHAVLVPYEATELQHVIIPRIPWSWNHSDTHFTMQKIYFNALLFAILGLQNSSDNGVTDFYGRERQIYAQNSIHPYEDEPLTLSEHIRSSVVDLLSKWLGISLHEERCHIRGSEFVSVADNFNRQRGQ